MRHQENFAQPPSRRSRGGFPLVYQSENHPDFAISGCFAPSFDRSATPPCGDARRGLLFASLRDEFPPAVLQIVVVDRFFLLPLFLDLDISPSPPVDRKDGEQGHGHPKRRCRGDDWQPVCPDSLTLPELGFRGGRRYSRHVVEGCIE